MPDGEATSAGGELEEAPAVEGDPLVSNGLGSPTCRSGVSSELSASTRRDCETSGFVGAASPTNGYGIDIHIDTGVVPLNGASLLSTVQNLIITPVWMALVWLTHVLVVMLEWCFSIELLEGAPAESLQHLLAQGQAMITTPWLAFALSVAAVAVAYHGLIRRRVADTLGEALLTVGMFVCGLWLMLDPSGTVGALSRWSDQAGLGTLAVVVSGTPVAPDRSLGTSMAGVYATSIEAPWCYLEFGNVDWCRDASRLEPGLKSAGLQIASRRLAEANCPGSGCSDGPATVAGALRSSVRLLREARTNGALFMALPANGPDRNSINQQGSLLHALCQSAEATHCRGPGAAEAQFRTNGGTWPRVGGLLLIAIGLVGMILLLGYIAVRLLSAAVLSVLFLLLAPAVVLAPAFGEAGRAVFRSWAVRLFGAVVSKLIFAFVLGTVLAATSILEALTSLGWWAQWLLMASFWWATFLKRNEILALDGGRNPGHRAQGTRMVREALAARNRFTDRREARRKRELGKKGLASPPAFPAGSGFSRPQLPVPKRPEPPQDEQVARVLRAESGGGVTAAERLARVDEGAARLARIKLERDRARRQGDSRRALRLDVRSARIEKELEADRGSSGEGAARPSGRSRNGRTQRATATARMLDEQAKLPGAGERADAQQRRDYPTLAGLAGYGRGDYERLDQRSQRVARLRIDRELAARRRATEPGPPGGVRPSERADDAKSGLRGEPARPERRRDPSSSRVTAGEDAEPSVMRDAREVAEGRKRQLGFGRQ